MREGFPRFVAVALAITAMSVASAADTPEQTAKHYIAFFGPEVTLAQAEAIDGMAAALAAH